MFDKAMTKRSEDKKVIDEKKQLLSPPVDILENENEFLLIADLPGVKSSELKVELYNNEVTLRAPLSSGPGVDLLSGGSARYEYARRFRVPAGVAGDKIGAELKNGVLFLHIPKEEAKKPRQIEVRAS